ncbi:hypothetical protein GWR56_08065 [Mucilaginibacter sp. 14171R-50]|uniref:hypothetical protein n=1 Tax=Mucilaginibacter sp. 14171R-50 TaxID=2703789 RepID=UPI00138D0602|nr:hypothetical protein [Mucilaginibacter sp. 14171R-50]QHS55496.1 hypothetical protein GWR56_08065 [Mucilaginibacter sp. 14171R-50]
METSPKKTTPSKKETAPSTGDKELKTDFPMSEKDEVKKAEQRTNKPVKKTT